MSGREIGLRQQGCDASAATAALTAAEAVALAGLLTGARVYLADDDQRHPR